jgi:Fur family transcriptional regulator, ferric uptake regulator
MQVNYVKILKNNGYRVTSPRLKIIKEIKTYPQTAKEIHYKLNDKSIDLVTVYRTLELLTSLNLLSRTVFDKNGIKYESLSDGKHHHHLICESCGKVLDVKVDDRRLLKDISEKHNFSINSHSLELWGRCVKCNEKN